MTSHSMDECSQGIVGVEFNHMAAMHGAIMSYI